MNEQLLKQLVDKKLSLREISEETGKSYTSIRYWLKKFGLKTEIEKYNKGGHANKTKSWRKQDSCEKCGETDPDRFYKRRNRNTNYSRCKTCHNKEQIERYRDYKKKAVEYKGGKCECCGYNKCMAALDFHHVDSSEKDSNWKKMRAWKFEKVKKELDKCRLVCRNCHAEIHYDK